MSSQENTENPKPFTAADNDFFKNLENLNEMTTGRVYEKSPMKVVNLDDNTTGVGRTPPAKRVKKPSWYFRSPNVQVFNLIVVYKLIKFDWFRLLQHPP